MNKNNSPYSAAITGGGFLLDETKTLLPLLLSDNAEELLKKEKIENNLLMVNTEKARRTIILEVKRRFKSVSRAFWDSFASKTVEVQKVAIFYVILKTYKLIFDFHINVAMKKYSSITRSIEIDDLMMEIEEIGANDEFVDGWSEATKKKVCSAYITILKKVGILDEENNLHPLQASDETWAEYLKLGEPWFLDFCLVPPYEIDRIKSTLL